MSLKIDQVLDEIDDTIDNVRGILYFYHYNCDEQDDRGWGCGYRTLQTLCSWVINIKQEYSSSIVPSITKIQEILLNLEDKPVSFIRSNQWIGTCEATMILSQLYDVDCKIMHISNGGDLLNYMSLLSKHFRDFGSPVMMGGDADAASKCILAVRSNKQLLILDPHYSGPSFTAINKLRESTYLRWYNVPNDFISSSFYNLCLPQLKKV
ncbi:unnamed protein product [Rotaria magnacalcarata]|uniref:UFSP1/2/DUB catalytic domain-containing protein n=4 Tax=Rotaria magnacalcarata TaxID=392030 RepID=A0A815B4U6_9BILA|nr:unnamed protein product [Rotaria magnacalcarata]CAF1414927.1 unnamed protein product [Rotaria magnacalcarata]